MSTRVTTVLSLGTLLAAMLALGCATHRPSPELVRARNAYDEASQGMTAIQNPAELRAAQRALAAAEAAHREDPGSQRERDLAYIADRKVRLAVAQTEAETAMAAQTEAEERLQRAVARRADSAIEQRDNLDERLETTRHELTRVQRELEERSNELSTRTQSLQQRQQELMAREAELREQREAREQAEREAREALQRLAQVREEQDRTIVTLAGSVLFESGESTILPEARQRLGQVAEAIKNHGRDKLITVVGHTDSRGAIGYNVDLSQARAESVRRFLVDRGLPPASIRAVGRGEAEPIADNSTAEGRAINRRVELVLEEAPQERTAQGSSERAQPQEQEQPEQPQEQEQPEQPQEQQPEQPQELQQEQRPEQQQQPQPQQE